MHFLSHTHETQEIWCFLTDLQIILLSLFELLDYIKVAKNAGAFLSSPGVQSFLCQLSIAILLAISSNVGLNWILEVKLWMSFRASVNDGSMKRLDFWVAQWSNFVKVFLQSSSPLRLKIFSVLLSLLSIYTHCAVPEFCSYWVSSLLFLHSSTIYAVHDSLDRLQCCLIENQQNHGYVVNWHFSRCPDECWE